MTFDATWRLSRQQRWRYDAARRPGGATARNVVVAVDLAAAVAPETVAASLRRVARDHPILRATVVHESGEPQLAIAAEPLVALTVERDAGELDTAGAAYGAGPFDRAAGPLWRAVLRTGDRPALLVAFDPLVADGVSAGVVLRDLAGGRPPAAPAPSYETFVDWQAERYGACAGPDLGFWRDLLAGVAVNRPFPLGGDPPAEPAGVERTRIARVPEAVSAGVTAFATRRRTTPFVARVTALLSAAARLSGVADLSVRVAVHGRPRGFESTVGVFANDVVLRTRHATANVGTLLAEVRATWLRVLTHQFAPYPWVLDCVEPGRLVTDHRPPELTVIAPGVGGAGLETRLVGPAYADPAGLVVTLAARGAEHEISVTYDAARFADTEVEALVTAYAGVLGEVAL